MERTRRRLVFELCKFSAVDSAMFGLSMAHGEHKDSSKGMSPSETYWKCFLELFARIPQTPSQPLSVGNSLYLRTVAIIYKLEVFFKGKKFSLAFVME